MNRRHESQMAIFFNAEAAKAQRTAEKQCLIHNKSAYLLQIEHSKWPWKKVEIFELCITSSAILCAFAASALKKMPLSNNSWVAG